jgi:hypothetical protein
VYLNFTIKYLPSDGYDSVSLNDLSEIDPSMTSCGSVSSITNSKRSMQLRRNINKNNDRVAFFMLEFEVVCNRRKNGS